MISGYNLKLNEPVIVWKEIILRFNSEVESLLSFIDEYFKQSGTIYDCLLAMSNNEYKTVNTESGGYCKRVNYTINLRYLKKVILHNNWIRFILYANEGIEAINVKITKDFFYSLEWEDSYYL